VGALATARQRTARLTRRTERLETAPAERVDPPPKRHGAWCRRFLPHYFRTDTPPADFHPELFDRLDTLHQKRGSKLALVAPREGAKSTIINLSYTLRVAVERKEPFVVVLSDSSDQANEQLGHIRAELETNAELARAYPDATGPGPTWRHDRLVLRNGVVIKALGRGKRVRGRRNRQDRPSLFVFDDVESNEDVLSPRKRERAWLWATREVIPAGDAGTNFLSVGSAIHPEAVAVRLGKLPGWKAQTFQAVHRWPERLDLWEEWERRATNLSDPDRKLTALAFYEKNRRAMDKGAAVYWPQRWPLYALMGRRAEIGAAAFDSEYQGVPNLGGLTEWPAEWWDDRPGKPFWFDEWPGGLTCKVVAVDASKGEGDGDYQAIAQVGIDRAGVFWCDCELRREPVKGMVARAIRVAREWGPVRALAAEVNGTIGLLGGEFRDQLGGDRIRFLAIENKENKEIRILTDLGPYLGRGRLRLRRSRGGQEVAAQGREFPHSTYDDGLDSISMGIRTIGKFARGEVV
jgi:hypothetical protein